MSSIPATDLNNLRFSRARAEEFGYLRRANLVLIVTLITVALGLGGALLYCTHEVHRLGQIVGNFQPAYVRINDVGKAEVVYYRSASYRPEAPEVINALTSFTTDFFTRMKGRTNDYWHAKYLLSQSLAQRSYQDDQKSKWIEAVERGGGVQNDVTVDRVTLVTLDAKSSVAYVDFTRNYYDGGVSVNRTERDTVTYYFEFLPKVDTKTLRWNPLGMVITDYKVQENFLTK